MHCSCTLTATVSFVIRREVQSFGAGAVEGALSVDTEIRAAAIVVQTLVHVLVCQMTKRRKNPF